MFIIKKCAGRFIKITVGIGTMIGYLKEISNQNKELIKLLKNRGDYDA